MKKWIFALCLAGIISACNPSARSLGEFESFTKRLTEKSVGFSQADWDDALQYFDYLWQDVQRYEYSEQDQQKIDSLRQQCVTVFSTHF